MATITISINGLRDVEQKLDKLSSGLGDMSNAMKNIAEDWLAFYPVQPFESQGGIFGTPWAGLQLSTIRNKKPHTITRGIHKGRSVGYANSTGILVASGAMRRSFKADTSANSVRLYNTRTVGRGLNLLSLHQQGAGNLPPRVVLALTQSRVNAAKHIIEGEVRRILNGV